MGDQAGDERQCQNATETPAEATCGQLALAYNTITNNGNIQLLDKDQTLKLNEQRSQKFLDKEKWSSAELKILHENFESFVTMHKIKDSKSFLFATDQSTKKKKKSLGFYEHMNNRLDKRTRHAVIKKIKQQLLSLKHGRLSVNEIKELCALQKTCGNRWREIACAMGRDSDALSQNYKRITAQRELKDEQKFGKWNAEETKKFIIAVDLFKVNNNRRRHERTKIDWKRVSQAVGTRSILQCKEKYFKTLTTKQKRGKFQYGKWDEQEIAKLKYAIGYDDIHCHTKTRCGFDWIKISEFVGARSSKQCMVKCYALLKAKEKTVSNQLLQKLSFREQKLHYWDQSYNKKLLKALKDENDETSIDWQNVKDQFYENYPIWLLKSKWYSLKVSQPNYQIRSFEKLIDNLCESLSVD